jgi:hypothetical protein
VLFDCVSTLLTIIRGRWSGTLPSCHLLAMSKGRVAVRVEESLSG